MDKDYLDRIGLGNMSEDVQFVAGIYESPEMMLEVGALLQQQALTLATRGIRIATAATIRAARDAFRGNRPSSMNLVAQEVGLVVNLQAGVLYSFGTSTIEIGAVIEAKLHENQ